VVVVSARPPPPSCRYTLGNIAEAVRRLEGRYQLVMLALGQRIASGLQLASGIVLPAPRVGKTDSP
jgi:hypothetical protein